MARGPWDDLAVPMGSRPGRPGMTVRSVSTVLSWENWLGGSARMSPLMDGVTSPRQFFFICFDLSVDPGMESEAPSKSSLPLLSLQTPSTRTAGLAWIRYKGAQPNEELRKAELDLRIWISQNSQDRFGQRDLRDASSLRSKYLLILKDNG